MNITLPEGAIGARVNGVFYPAFYTIRAADVGQTELYALGAVHQTDSIKLETSRTLALGTILPMDVGRRLYLRDGSLVAEGNAARVARTMAEITDNLAIFRARRSLAA